MSVQVIKRQVAEPQAVGTQRRTCCYVRVSTSHEEQEMSFEAQRAHYEALIEASPDLVYAGTYADEGVSGTGTAHRDGFNRMMADAEARRFDQVLTKSISRFGRNTVDTLNAVRRLKALGIGVRFEKEGVWTLDGTGELLLTILSSLAQAESQSISENVKMGIRYRFQEGKPFVNCARFLGYDKADGRLAINPGEAATVRRIFAAYLNGRGADAIARRLTDAGARTGAGGTRWYPANVRYILSNEKYAGDLRLQKTVVPNFLTHRSRPNAGEADQFYVENAHEPIIPREVFDMARAEQARRSTQRLEAQGRPTGGARHGGRSALSGRCRCTCGTVLRRKRGDPCRWACPACGFSVAEDALRDAVLDAFRGFEGQRERLRGLLADAEGALAEAGRAGARLRRFRILVALDWLQNRGKPPLDAGSACHTLEQFIAATRPGPLEGWDDDLALEFIEGVDLTDGGVAVRFKAGVTVEA